MGYRNLFDVETILNARIMTACSAGALQGSPPSSRSPLAPDESRSLGRDRGKVLADREVQNVARVKAANDAGKRSRRCEEPPVHGTPPTGDASQLYVVREEGWVRRQPGSLPQVEEKDDDPTYGDSSQLWDLPLI